MRKQQLLSDVTRANDFDLKCFYDLLTSADEMARCDLPGESISPQLRYLLSDVCAELRAILIHRNIDFEDEDTQPLGVPVDAIGDEWIEPPFDYVGYDEPEKQSPWYNALDQINFDAPPADDADDTPDDTEAATS